jgi:hypothetical protein
MPDVTGTLEYLQKLELYESEKPYWCFLPPHDGFNPDVERVDNLEFEDHSDVHIRDIRDLKHTFKIDDCGFEVVSHRSRFSSFQKPDDVAEYRAEADQLLKDTLDAVFVKSYDSILRRNVPFQRNQMDLADPLHTEGPARGVHNGTSSTFQKSYDDLLTEGPDITYDSGPAVINRYLTDEEKSLYLKPGYRFRIIK